MDGIEVMTFHESYGDLPESLLKTINRLNVSPADYRELETVYGEGNYDGIHKAVLRYSENGMYSPYLMMQDQHYRNWGDF